MDTEQFENWLEWEIIKRQERIDVYENEDQNRLQAALTTNNSQEEIQCSGVYSQVLGKAVGVMNYEIDKTDKHMEWGRKVSLAARTLVMVLFLIMVGVAIWELTTNLNTIIGGSYK